MNYGTWIRLTPEAQRIKVADALGYVLHITQRDACPALCRGFWVDAAGNEYHIGQPHGPSFHWDVFRGTGIPDYLNDLNAMHEVEWLLTDEQRVVYLLTLDILVMPGGDRCFATAALRAAAFVITTEET